MMPFKDLRQLQQQVVNPLQSSVCSSITPIVFFSSITSQSDRERTADFSAGAIKIDIF